MATAWTRVHCPLGWQRPTARKHSCLQQSGIWIFGLRLGSFPSSSLGTGITAWERIPSASSAHPLGARRRSGFPDGLKQELLGLGSQAGAWEPAQTTPTSNTWGIRRVSGHIYPGLRRRAAPSGLHFHSAVCSFPSSSFTAIKLRQKL